ncbi:MAG: ubiquinol-cytochrome C chaperone family protein [Parvibaculum sp.]|uniref:ubiquinol-cytochrome C chaperone family protein n=1 Tax=Parvibaculum sp. TaxID=2024848 RepID=UPI00284CA9CB|nr:ubiquinol-cytochrome C chaperone family protein [Parvibaculum sp.]MDR3500383.1 ubiquinol-cytochrome C chaperone family protein [Parvibaculum sp.]
MIWKRFFGRSDVEAPAFALYGCIVAQARRPEFYLRAGVPDTLEGRFEMLMLNAFLVLHRLKAAGEPAKALGQRVFDILFDDMDQTLREIGIGDLSVGKKIKTMAAAFYGRIAAYDEALGAADEAALEQAIRRNVFDGLEPKAEEVALLSVYVRRASDALARQGDAALIEGRADFAPVLEGLSG